jgi:ComF family protein
MFQHLLSVLFPSSATVVTPPNLQGLIPVCLRMVDLRAQGIESLDGLVAASLYAESKELQDVIRRFKYLRQRSLSDVLARPMADAFMLCSSNVRTTLCPVPLHWSRRFARGFNQAELLARGVSRLTGQPVGMFLRRIRPTGHQAWRTHDERRLAMESAFSADRRAPLRVTLVDDVATTVSTLDACACALKDAGVAHVDAIVVALG